METIINFVFAYPLSILFVVFVTISSFSHLWVNRAILNKKFLRTMIFPIVPTMLVFMTLVVYSFFDKEGAPFPYIVPLTLLISLLFGGIKSIVPRSDYNDGVIEVLGVFTPKYPSEEDTFWNRYEWHQKMDMLAFLGLSIFIFLDWKILPWIWEGLSLSR